MKYAKLVVLILILFGCNNQPKQPETVSVDTIQADTSIVMKRAIAQVVETNRKTPPPLGMQNSKEEGIVMGKSSARALAVPAGEQRNVLENKDTQVITTTNKSVSYTETDITIRRYNPGNPPVNKPPTANAGADKSITLPVSTTSLAGSGSDQDGTISTYAWEKVTGGTATISSPTAANTNVSGLVQGEYVFRLTVKDNQNATATDEVKVTVIKDGSGKVDYMNLPIAAPLDLSGKSGIVVENKRFVDAPSIAIKMYGGANNITIRNCTFDGAAQELVELENATNITIENCLFIKGYSGVYAVGSKNVKIINCQFVNMRIKWINGQFSGKGQFAQFNSCTDILVENCKGENFPEADPEDMISMYRSSNAIVRNNIFRGNPTSSWSNSGGGIIAGDNGGDNILIENNTIMTPGNYGIAIAGGNNNRVLNNKIYSERNAVSNNPLYVWKQDAPTCSSITVKGNRVYWIDKNGARNNGWFAGNCSSTVFDPPTNITLSEMGVPTHLIDFLTPTELLEVRK